MADTRGSIASSRRDILSLGLATAAGLAPAARAADSHDQSKPGSWVVGIEGQRRADLGNGGFLNPVLAGDRADPNVLKDGHDYYAAFSTFLYYPGVVIWHSRDLVNWAPVGPALTKVLGSVFAVDLAKHGDRYFIYIPVFVPPATGAPAGPPFKIYVVHADNMRGPWSEPVDMGIDGFIDPGHAVGEDGRRYLFLNNGHRVRINDNGLARAGSVDKVYDGWPIPDDWVIEGVALEGPKLLRHGGWFYMFSGQGGTAGPPTSHMVVVARSRSINGSWENCPHNPLVRTRHRDEPWWSRGHATPVQGPAGDWWLVYHGYENGFRTLGRQMLLEPFEWTADGWPIARGGDLSSRLRKPAGAVPGPHGLALSDDFDSAMLGSKLAFYAPTGDYLARVQIADGALKLAARGEGPGTSSPLAFIAGDRSYEVSVSVELQAGTQGGLLLFYDDELFCGIGFGDGRLRAYKLGEKQRYPPPPTPPGLARTTRLHMRVVNDENVATFFYRQDGARWTKVGSFEVSGYNHNVGDGFLSLRPALFASGKADAKFRTLRYRAMQ